MDGQFNTSKGTSFEEDLVDLKSVSRLLPEKILDFLEVYCSVTMILAIHEYWDSRHSTQQCFVRVVDLEDRGRLPADHERRGQHGLCLLFRQ